jgi:hypothetical protein
MSVEIKECYSVKPFFNPKASVERLLAGISKEYISGLATVILRDSDSLNHDRRRAKVFRLGKKVRISKCEGVYHEAWKGEPAWIEIFIDNVIPDVKDSALFRLLMRFSFIQDVYLSGALYHEIGHHIHKTQKPEYGEREQIADRWKKRLKKAYIQRRYWYIVPWLRILLWPIFKLKKIKY